MYLGRENKNKMTPRVMLDILEVKAKTKNERNRTWKFLLEKDLPVFYVISPGCEVSDLPLFA